MSELITLSDPRSPAAEAYRALRTGVQFSAVDKPIRTLLVASCAAEDGKSAAAANLAVTFAQGGSRVILVDADLRRPAQHTIWKLSNERGFTTLMRDPDALKNPPLQQPKVDHLSILPTGELPPNPADLFGSQRMSEVINSLREAADLVIFDAPPVLAVSDTALLATKVDAVLLVIRAEATRRDHARRAKETLERLQVRLIGAALTNAPRGSVSQY